MVNFAKAHILKKALRLDDGAWRDRMERDTGKRSLRELSYSQYNTFVGGLQRDAGENDNAKTDGRKALKGKYVKKLQALWISGWNLGIIHNRSDEAMLDFIKGQTKLEHVQFLHDAEDAKKVIEALKSWLEREGGVHWNAAANFPNYILPAVFPVVLAQWHILKTDSQPRSEFKAMVMDIAATQNTDDFTKIDWVAASKAFGVLVRKQDERH